MAQIAFEAPNSTNLPPVDLPSFEDTSSRPQITINARQRDSGSGDAWSAFPEADAKTVAKTSSWDAFPESTGASTEKPLTAKERVYDAGASAGSGIVRGITGLLGAPADLAELGAKGIDKATQAIQSAVGMEPTARPENTNGIHLPGSEDINKAVAPHLPEYASPDYKPKTGVGEYLQTGGEFVPAALMGPGGLARKMVTQAAIPAAASETAGQLTKGSAFEPVARMAGGFGGGVAGGILSRGGTAARGIRNQLPDYVTDAHIDRAEKLIQAGKNRGIDLTWPEALSKVTGRQVLTDMQRLLESSAKSRPQMQSFMGERPTQIDRAAESELRRHGPGNSNPSTIGPEIATAADSTLHDVRKAINAKAKPFYDKSENILLNAAEMARVRAVPGFAEAADAVRGDVQLNRHVAHLPENSIGFLNEVKKYLDQAAKNATAPMSERASVQRAAGLGGDAKAVKTEAVNKSVDYATALALEAHLREKYLEPLLNGPLGKLAELPDTKKAIGLLFSANPLPGSAHEISTALSAVVKRNPQAARDLVRAHIEMTFNEATQNLQTGLNEFGGAKFAARLAGNSQQKANLKAAIEAVSGPQAWRGFETFLDVLEATGKRQAIGSKTAFNIDELKALGSGSLAAEATKLAASPGKWWSYVNDKWSHWQQGQNLEQLAKIITDPRAAGMFKQILAMPKDSTAAGAIAVRMILQSEQASDTPAARRAP